MENTLVTCVHCPEFFKNGQFNLNSKEVAKQIINSPPRNVLDNLFNRYYLAEYLGFAPSIIEATDEHTYLHIDSFTREVSKFQKTQTIDEFLGNKEFYSSIREQEISEEEKTDLKKRLLSELNPNSDWPNAVWRPYGTPEVYHDLLAQVGVEMTCKQISDILSKIMNNFNAREMKERIRRAEAWNVLGSQVVGGEISR